MTQDDIQQEGLRVASAFTNKRQQALLATGRRWIKNQSSKFRRKIARSCRNKSNDTYNSVSSFSLLFLLFLVGDVELNPGPAVTLSNSHSENSVLELPILVAIGNQHQGDACGRTFFRVSGLGLGFRVSGSNSVFKESSIGHCENAHTIQRELQSLRRFMLLKR